MPTLIAADAPAFSIFISSIEDVGSLVQGDFAVEFRMIDEGEIDEGEIGRGGVRRIVVRPFFGVTDHGDQHGDDFVVLLVQIRPFVALLRKHLVRGGESVRADGHKVRVRSFCMVPPAVRRPG